MGIEIRPLTDNRELEQAERLQQVVWGGPSLVPAATMRAILEVGGCVLGAWAGDRLVGFCFGFPGWRERRPLPPGLERPAAAGGAVPAARTAPAAPGSPAVPAGTRAEAGPPATTASRPGAPPSGGRAGPATVPRGEAGIAPAPGAPPAGGAAATRPAPPPVPGGGAREPVFHSDLLAVDPAYRDRGIGRRLKWAQRQWALEQGLYLITWTYDPLQARNGFLNLTRLGGIARRYVREFYGVLDDEINRGLPADRLVIEWYLDSDRVSRRAAAEDDATAGTGGHGVPGPDPAGVAAVPTVNRVRAAAGPDDLPEPAGWQPPGGEPAVAVEIPARFGDWRAGRPDWALAWRFHLREVLEAYLAAGYLLDACERWQPGRPTTRYILRRQASSHLLP